MTTRERILDAAERLFAEHGYDGTSLRAVTGQAEVNLAAANYHFGTKLALFQAVVERRVQPLTEERFRRLDELTAAPAEPTLEQLLEAFLAPALRPLGNPDDGTAAFVRVLARIQSESGEHVQAFLGAFRESRARFFPAFARALPHLDAATLEWRMHFVIGLMCSVLSDPHKIRIVSDGRCDTTDPAETLAQVVAFASAGLRAPKTHESVVEGESR